MKAIICTSYGPPEVLQLVYLDVLSMADKISSKDLESIRDIIEKGKLISVINKRYTLDQMTEVHKHVEKGHKKGNIVIKVQ